MDPELQIYKRESDYFDYSVDLNKIYYQRILQDMNRFSSRRAGKKILDVGCFDGTLAAQFLPDWTPYGLEGDIKACETANEKGVQAKLHDLEKPFPFDKDTFDGVIAAEVIEHVYDTDFFLQEIKRVLKHDGILVMSIPNIACLTNRIAMLFGNYPRYAEYQAGGAGHIRVYTAGVFYKQVLDNGFKIIRFVGCNLPCPMHNKWIPTWIKKIAVKGGDFFPSIAGQVLLTAKKD